MSDKLATHLENITDRAPLGFIPDSINIFPKYNISEYLENYITNYTFSTTAVWKRILKNVLYQHQSNCFQQWILMPGSLSLRTYTIVKNLAL